MTPKDHPELAGDRFGLAAMILYVALSALFFGRSLAGNFAGGHLGRGPDPSFLIWALEWWPYALAHKLNPFLCRIVWAPGGFNLAWSGSIPLAALAAAPMTSTCGPVIAYNALCLLAPAIAAWCAFHLCRSLVKSYWPAFIGGYIFGFSSYVLGQMVAGHLNLLFIFPAPLIVRLVSLRLGGRLHALSFTVLLAFAFAMQFLLSIELAATVVLFGGLTLAWSFAAADGRLRITALALPLGGAALLALFILSPYFYYLLRFGVPSSAINSPGAFSADLLNLVVPTPAVGAGTLPAFAALSRHFPGNLGEAGAYLGIPLIAIVALYGRAHWHEPIARTLVSMLLVISILAVGPRLHVAGATAFGMPWKLLMHVPMLKSALPVRFMAYASLAAGVIVALWLADETAGRWLRGLMAGALIILSLPNPDAGFFCAPTSTPAFFTSGAYRRYLSTEHNVVVLPYAITGDSMLWQAETKMSFKMAGGYTGIMPREFERWPIVGAFSTKTLIPDAAIQLRAFMAAHSADTIVVDDRQLALWAPLLTTVDPAPVSVAGVSVYRLGESELAPYRDAGALEMEKRSDAARMAALLVAARQYLAQGRDVSQLTPMSVQRAGLLPPNWVNDPDIRTKNGLYLGPWKDAAIAVGVVGSYEALAPTIGKYRQDAARVFFPYPKELNGVPTGDTFMRLLVMVFDRRGLAHAAAQAPAEF